MSVPNPSTTDWVPLYAGATGIAYKADHVPATTYNDGDVVVKDGVAYMCVGGPTTADPNPTPWGAAMAAGGVPTGATMCWFTVTPPPGWLVCAGQAISRVTYAALFALWGTAYGVGDGSTTFNLPDCQGRMPIGVGSHADVNALGKNDGVAVASRSPKHRHSVSDGGHVHGGSAVSTVSDPTHAHGVADPGHTHNAFAGDGGADGYLGQNNGQDGNWYGGVIDTRGTGIGIYGAATGVTVSTSVTVAAAGTGISIGPGGAPLDAPPFIAVNWIVKV